MLLGFTVASEVRPDARLTFCVFQELAFLVDPVWLAIYL